MSEWIIKHFYKSKAVKIRLFHPDHRSTLHWVIPDGNSVTLGGYSFLIDKDRVSYEKNIPTYLFSTHTTEPVASLHPLLNQPNGLHDAKTFNTALRSKVVKEFLDSATGGLNSATLGLIMSGVALIAIMVLGYYMYTQFNELKQIITPVIQMWRL